MQLDELMEDVPRDKASVIFDYEPSGEPQRAPRCSSAWPR